MKESSLSKSISKTVIPFLKFWHSSLALKKLPGIPSNLFSANNHNFECQRKGYELIGIVLVSNIQVVRNLAKKTQIIPQMKTNQSAQFKWKMQFFVWLSKIIYTLAIYLQQFDPKTKTLKIIPKYFVFDMIKDQLYFNQFILKVGELSMDDGFLFPNSKEYTYLSDLQIVSSQYDQEYSKNMYGEELISILFFNLDQIKTVNMVEYPKISEILADTGSIISWVLSISFFVSKYNESIGIQKAKGEIIKMYYHDFKDFQIKKNWLGKFISIYCRGREYDPKKSEEIYNRLNQIAIEKMNYLNLQNEVAKLQLILQEHLGLQQIKKYLEQKYKLEHLFDKLGIPEKNIQSSNQILPSDQSYMRNAPQQVNSESEILQQKENTLDQEFEERIELLINKNLQHYNRNKENQDSSQNININLQVINLEQSQSSLK